MQRKHTSNLRGKPSNVKGKNHGATRSNPLQASTSQATKLRITFSCIIIPLSLYWWKRKENSLSLSHSQTRGTHLGFLGFSSTVSASFFLTVMNCEWIREEMGFLTFCTLTLWKVKPNMGLLMRMATILHSEWLNNAKAHETSNPTKHKYNSNSSFGKAFIIIFDGFPFVWIS